MNEPTNDHDIGQRANDNIVLTDSDIAKLERGREVYAQLVLKQRLAMYNRAKALGAETSVSEEPALEFWEEMPQVAKDFKAFDSDELVAV